MTSVPQLPIEAIFSAFCSAITQREQLIIHAPPGAGKSTRLPLWLLNDRSLVAGKIYLIQPRRLAANSVARYLAWQLGEPLGKSIGLRTRYETVVGPAAQIEVMTEGVFIRLIQSDPELAGIGCVIFDEFHERSLSLDLGLALSIETQQGYRDVKHPLKLIIMSATLAADQLRESLPDALLLRSEGRTFPIVTHYSPLKGKDDLIRGCKVLLQKLFKSGPCSVLVFLPGMREIRGLESQLQGGALPASVNVYALHSALADRQQQAAIAPAKPGECKIVLATNVAETSITIDGITVVIDSGYAKVSLYDSHKGMSRLVTQKISKASADQRQGRAGRTAPGDCYRLWSKESHHSLYDYELPAILREDLSTFLLELALWGETQLDDLILLDRPKPAALANTQKVLTQLRAISDEGVITKKGLTMAGLGLHPRLAVMCIAAVDRQCLSEACLLATLLTEPMQAKHGRQADILMLLNDFYRVSSESDGRQAKGGSQGRLLQMAKKLVRRVDGRHRFDITGAQWSQLVPALLLLAFPDKLARQRANNLDRYITVSGIELRLHPEDHLSGSPWLLVTDFSSGVSAGQPAYIHQAVAINESELSVLLGKEAAKSVSLSWSDELQSFIAREKTILGAIVLSERPIKPDKQQLCDAIIDYVADNGLAVLGDDTYRDFDARVAFYNGYHAQSLPDVSERAMLASIDDWLPACVKGVKTKAGLQKINVKSCALARLSWPQQQALKAFTPESVELPSGNSHRIDYLRLDRPVVSVRMQECYGLTSTPTIGHNTPVLMELLSPAHRPLQLTDDLPGFWSGSYHEVAKEMRGRYPRHFWPDEPSSAKATATTKKRMK